MRSTPVSRWARAAIVAAITTGVTAVGCRVNEDDVHRWETTEHGPDKLVAVVTHDKYEPSLRVESALALVRMKPRGGRRVGIMRMVDALSLLNPESRKNGRGGHDAGARASDGESAACAAAGTAFSA